MLRFQKQLIKGTLIKRYKRFLADVRLESGDIITAHRPNSGSMWGIKEPGLTVYVQAAADPGRKLGYTLELVEVEQELVGCNTQVPNKLIGLALETGEIPEFQAYKTARREVKYGENSRVDYLLTQPGLPDYYVEIKNVHMMRTAGLAEFPDSVTSRGAKHALELAQKVKEGHRAVFFYLVQRMDCNTFAIAVDLDPTYARNMEAAQHVGVEILCYNAYIDLEGIRLGKKLSIR